MNPSKEYPMKQFERLLRIMDELREKCPWDKKQTYQSLRYLTIEEVYELSDAIVQNNLDDIKKELGDILLHVVFYAKIASESGAFAIADVIDALCEKLIVRHPHVYGNVAVADEEEVKSNWEKIKITKENTSILSGVPASLPALIKAIRIQEKARGVGFDWAHKGQVWEKVKEEIFELETEANQPTVHSEKLEAEFGDVLFSLINYARFLGINPEDALEKTNQKFIKRFNYLETESKKDGKEIQNMTLEEMDVYWERAKRL